MVSQHALRQTPLWTEFLTHTTENITLPQTSFAGGKNTPNMTVQDRFANKIYLLYITDCPHKGQGYLLCRLINECVILVRILSWVISISMVMTSMHGFFWKQISTLGLYSIHVKESKDWQDLLLTADLSYTKVVSN